MESRRSVPIGRTEQEARAVLEEELVRSLRAEGAPTLHAPAHSVARLLEADHPRIAGQLAAAGIDLRPHASAGNEGTP